MAENFYDISQGLQDVLFKRRMEARQAMIDKLNEQKVQADIENDKARIANEQYQNQTGRMNAENLGGYYKAQTENMANDNFMNVLDKGVVRPDSDIAGLDADFSNRARKLGLIVRKPTPTVTTSEPRPVFDPETSPDTIAQFGVPNMMRTDQVNMEGGQEVFAGTQKQHDAEVARAKLEAFKALTPEQRAKMDPLELSIMMADAGLISNVSPSALPHRKVPNIIIGPTGKVTNAGDVDEDAKVTHLGFAPQPNATSQPQLWQLAGNDGKSYPFMGTAAEVKAYLASHPEISGVRKGNEPAPRAAAVAKGMFDDRIMNDLANWRAKATAGGGTPQNPTGTPDDVAGYRSYLATVIIGHVKPELRQAAMDVMNSQRRIPKPGEDPKQVEAAKAWYAKASSEDIAAKLAQANRIKPEQATEFAGVLYALRGY